MLRANLLWLLQSTADACHVPARRSFAKLADIHASTLVKRKVPSKPAPPKTAQTSALAAGASTTEASSSAATPAGSKWLAWLPWRKKLSTWEKVYWGAGVTALTFIGYVRFTNRETEEQRLVREEKERELAAQRKEFLMAVLAGRSFLEGDDPFKGMLPKQIQEFVEEHKGELSVDDPFEGLSPEEIDEYVAKHGMAR